MQLTQNVLVTAYYIFREIDNVNTQGHFLKKEKFSKHIFNEKVRQSFGYLPYPVAQRGGACKQVPDISTIYRTKIVNLIKIFYEKSEVNFKQKLEMNEAVTASYADW